MIIPVILEQDFNEVLKKLELIDGAAELIQIDIADGVLEEGKTFLETEKLNNIHTKSALEVHLMVKNPCSYVQRKLENVVSICAQVEAKSEIKKFIEMSRKLGYRTGISVGPHTFLAQYQDLLDLVDFVQFMTIEPGKQGNKFITKMLLTISAFKHMYPKMPVQVDGGVKTSNLGLLLQRGINNVVIGSEIFSSKDPKKKLLEMQKTLPTDKDQISSLSKIHKIGILGGAAWKEDEEPYKQAYEVSKLLSENGYEIINGGGPGVMKAATEGAHAAGKNALVVTYHPNKPKRHYEGVSPENKFDEEVVTLDYFDRTKVMLQNTDVHIVFKGSIGTLSEFGMTWVSSWIHEPNSKGIIMYGDFWNDFLDAVEKSFTIKMGERELLKVCTTPEQVLDYIQSLEK
jgi:ribulose-phosphate 3-epimerase